MESYFSDRDSGPKERVKEEISIDVWGGLILIIEEYIRNGGFGWRFPLECPDWGEDVCGCDEKKFLLAFKAEIPNMEWPLKKDEVPTLYDVMDFLEFCYRSVAEPLREGRYFHKTYGHFHLGFDREAGQKEFRTGVNRIFFRNNLAYELNSIGQIERIAPEILRETLIPAIFQTGDHILDGLLNAARAKFLSPDFETRKESLEKLWDAWERLKTIEYPKPKRESIEALLNQVTDQPAFRKELDDEAHRLTYIGNNFQIRHTEVGQVPIEQNEQIDYLFHRLFALIHLLMPRNSIPAESNDMDIPF